MTYQYQSQLSTTTSLNLVSHGRLCRELLWKETTPYKLHGLKILFFSIQPMKWFSLTNLAKTDIPSFASMDDHHRVNGL